MKKLILLLMVLLNSAIFISSIESTQEVHITGTSTKPASFTDTKTIKFENKHSSEYVEIVVKGTIYEFKLLSLKIDDDSNLVDGDIKFAVKTVFNKTIVINTTLPGGMPSEKLKWKDSSGKEFEYLISDYNTGMGPESHKFTISK